MRTLKQLNDGEVGPLSSLSLRSFLRPISLILLNAIPIFFGISRIADLGKNTAELYAPLLPMIVHIVSATIYCIAGAFQFMPYIRTTKKALHRLIGRVLIPCGFIVAVSGLWLAHYPREEFADPVSYGLRLIAGLAMLLFLIIGTIEIRQRNFSSHGVWMARAYAVGIAAGTQALTLATGVVLAKKGLVNRELVSPAGLAAGWLINLLVVEFFIWKRVSIQANSITPSV